MKMKVENLDRLKEILAVPTHSRSEDLMIEYLQKVLTAKGFDHYTDTHGNIYVTKGISENYPCFVAHTDTVHYVNFNLEIVQEETVHNGVTLRGIDKVTKRPSGCGGDDKCGIYLVLEMLDTLSNVKGAFFVSEEIGCKGSQHADPEFFKNVGYCIQYDSPEGNSMSLTLMGRYLFNQDSEFATKVGGLIREHGVVNWASHPYTDVWQIMEKFDIACLNLAAGYYRYHTADEYVKVDEVQNGFELGLRLVEILGENKYANEKETYHSNNWSNRDWYKKPNKNNLLLENKKETTDNLDENGEDFLNSGEYVYSDRKKRGDNNYYGYYWGLDEDFDW